MTEPLPFMPKKDLRFDEFMAIKNEFSSYNFFNVGFKGA